MKEYTVCFLFTADLEQVLLIRKGRTEFKGLLNGVGGELHKNEDPCTCAMREIYEETGLGMDDMLEIGGKRLMPLGTLDVPHDCKYGTDGGCRLHYFAGIMLEGAELRAENRERAGESLVLRYSSDAASSGVRSGEYAGSGDLAYFVAAALRRLAPYKQKAERPVDKADALCQMLALHRGYLDAAFRDGNLALASDEAAAVSKLAYAAWCQNNQV